MITHCIQCYDYKEALHVLTKNALDALRSPENERRARFRRFEGLFYKFSPALMRHCPEETVKSWIEMNNLLDPKKLIPSLIQCNAPPETIQKLTSAAIQYLEFCVNKLHNTERAIHNFLVSSYTQSTEASDRTKLLSYLVDQAKVAGHVMDTHSLTHTQCAHTHTHSTRPSAMTLSMPYACVWSISWMSLVSTSMPPWGCMKRVWSWL